MFSRITVQLPAQGLLFRRLSGSEALSQSFVLQAELLSTDARIDRKSLLGKPVTFTLPTDGLLSAVNPRYINGKITQIGVRSEELGGVRYAVYGLTVEPDLWPMKRDRNLRIFQSQTVPQIVQTLLKEYGVNVETRLAGSYRVWEYCVQYQESSFDFISRLMELEGIYYFFRHEADKHTLVLCDAPDQHQSFPGYETIAYHVTPSGGSVTEEGVSQWALSESVTPGMYSTDDYDFRKPNAWMLQARQNPASPTPGSVDVYDWPGRFVEHGHGEYYARVRQEVWQVEHHMVSGSGTATGIAPGYTFALLNAPHFSDNGKYLVTSAHYDFEENSYASGDVGATRHNIDFRVLPAAVTYRAKPETPWPKTHGPQTAKVVGPKGESIWTDKYGRVKVKFHWDRLAKGDDTSSCWVRVSSAWAGQGFGGVQIPRVNDEVVVDFINGDPDRPLIIGRVYNEASMPPWALPAAATQMGFLSRSKDGTADTANALRFEDKAGEEHLWIQAQKNMDTHVKNDSSHSVANNHSHYAGGNELYRVETNRVHGVKGGEERLTGQGKIDNVVETYVLGSGTKLRLECGESAIELNANGHINIVGKGFNLFVNGDGHITTSGGKLNLNTSGAKPGTGAPGASHKGNITQAVVNLFPPKQKGQAAPAAPKSNHLKSSGGGGRIKNQSAPVAQKAQSSQPNKLDDKIVRSIMKSEGATGEQGGIPEMYGFRKGFGPAYDDIAAARKTYGQGSEQEFNIVSKYMNESARKAGALNFTDPSKQAAVMSLAHMRGVGGSQAILNSMSTGNIVKSSTLTNDSINYIEKMSPSDFQNDLLSARLNYDKAIYGSTTTVKNGVAHNWWDYYSGGLTKRYTKEATEFLKFSGE